MFGTFAFGEVFFGEGDTEQPGREVAIGTVTANFDRWPATAATAPWPAQLEV